MANGAHHHLSGLMVEKRDDKTFKISWDELESTGPVRIFAGDTPTTIDTLTPVAEVKGQNAVEFTLAKPAFNPYFKIAPQDGKEIVWAQRQLPLEKTYNFRDVGGYPTEDKRRMRWGLIYRSAHLSELSDQDHVALRRIGIKLVCDFRTREEAQAQPDRLPQDGSIEYLHMPIAHGKFDPAEALEKIKQGDISWLTDDFMPNNYVKQIDNFAGLWKQFFEHLMKPEKRPLVFHCTAGKDRTGVCAALILLSAGVPESTVIADHALSNTYNAAVIARIKKKLEEFGIDPEAMHDYLTAPRNAMEAVLTHLKKNFGSAKQYLIEKAGIDSDDLERLRMEITEE